MVRFHALNTGLIVFLVVPGLLPAGQGLIGLTLAALAVGAAAVEHRQRLAVA